MLLRKVWQIDFFYDFDLPTYPS